MDDCVDEELQRSREAASRVYHRAVETVAQFLVDKNQPIHSYEDIARTFYTKYPHIGAQGPCLKTPWVSISIN